MISFEADRLFITRNQGEILAFDTMNQKYITSTVIDPNEAVPIGIISIISQSKEESNQGDQIKLITCSNDYTLRLWEFSTEFSRIQLMEGHSDVVTSICVNYSGKEIISSGFDGTIRIWELEGRDYRLIKIHRVKL